MPIRRTPASQASCTGASAMSRMLKPNVPRTKALNVARLSDAVAIAPQKAPSPNAAERRPNARASTCSVSETSSGTSVLKLKPDEPDARHHDEHDADLPVVPGEGQPFARALEQRDGAIGGDRVQLGSPHRDERRQDGEEADRVDDEAEADPGDRDDDPGDRRADDPRGVDEARVQRDGVRQLSRPDHLERQRLASGPVEHERDAAERREEVDDRERRGSGQRDERERRRDEHRRGLRPDDEEPRLEPVDDRAREEAEQRVRDEPAEEEQADGERRAGEGDDEPGEGDVLHPRPCERDDLTREEEPVVVVTPKAAERARAERKA